MKTITVQEHNLILDVTGEGLTPLPAAALEKDLLVTEVLQRIQPLETGEINLVFCGGTSLSKAHGLIERMSEDIDFKVIVPEGLSRSARSKQLSQLKNQLADFLLREGYIFPDESPLARDENNYVSFSIRYASRFSSVASLRPEIKVELSARTSLLPLEHLPVHSILGALVDGNAPDVLITCQSVQESLGEKVLSFLRRTAEAMAGRNRAEYDDRLIRHIYDVSVIYRQSQLPLSELTGSVFQKMVAADALRFSRQYPEFKINPVQEMQKALERLKSDEEFANQYTRFVDELVYGNPVPFTVAQQDFIRLAEQLLSSI
ncbi:MAG: nucleotidyl transferase AbiEii/AbiGii toxin family protein [Chlorobiales bacterium]|nr:nucleotidyl transferase AbiEii/AbiGii toxin family protein [Chlorobiales bacterium]